MKRLSQLDGPIIPILAVAMVLCIAGGAAAQAVGARATVLGGIKTSPAYFGSDEYEAAPTFSLTLEYLRLPGGFQLGDPAPSGEIYGFRPRFSFRYITERDVSDHAELAGLDDVDTAVELGAGLGYEARDYRVFADVRNGVVGHNDWVGILGADAIARPSGSLTLSAGPRVNFGDGGFANTYFGVSPAESAASGLSAYDPGGGITSVGMEVSARYNLSDRWGVEGVAAYDRLVDDAGNSPVVELGSEDQYELRLGLTRDISLGF